MLGWKEKHGGSEICTGKIIQAWESPLLGLGPFSEEGDKHSLPKKTLGSWSKTHALIFYTSLRQSGYTGRMVWMQLYQYRQYPKAPTWSYNNSIVYPIKKLNNLTMLSVFMDFLLPVHNILSTIPSVYLLVEKYMIYLWHILFLI